MIAYLHLAYGKLSQAAHWALLCSVLAFGLPGCKNWETHEPGFRDKEMAETVRKARPAKKEKEIDYWSFDERGRQIERDLAGQH